MGDAGTGRRVVKAVFPAAGYGTRFLPATKAQPKETLPIVDRPAIQYMVEEAVRAGLDDLLVITGRNKQPIEDHFDRNPELEDVLREKGKHEELEEVVRLAELGVVHYVRQAEQLGLGHAVLQARQHVGEQPFAVLLGDDIIDPHEKFLERMLDVFEETGRPVVAVMPVPDEQVASYGIVTTHPRDGDGLHDVSDLVEKPSPSEAPSNLAIIGRYILTHEVFEVLADTPPGRGGEIQLTDALRTMARDEPIVAVEYTGARHDMGDTLGFLKANVALAADRPDIGERFLGWLEGFLEERRTS
ncbi:MAG TPA: UTP--glucose-1-phosphate uridylyltransferase GalU [Nitriliruptorales bacterium]|nr:UTP--glucose-1-phosphate uridylyltransferase GalU [Nitriliruptorales bacterium]